MEIRCGPVLIFALVFLLCGVVTRAASVSAAGAYNKTPLTLPEVVVTERNASEELWYMTETASYQIFCDGDGALIRQFARVLDESELITATVWHGPMPGTSAGKLTLVLCTTNKSFRRFVPAKVSTEVNLDFVDRLRFGTVKDQMLIFMCSQHGNEGLGRSLLRSYAHRVLAGAATPPLPEWFVVGMSEIISFATVTDQRHGVLVTFGQVDGPNGHPPSLPPVMLNLTVHLSDDVRAIIDGSLDEKVPELGPQEDDEPNAYMPSERVSFSRYFGIYPFHHALADVIMHKPAVSPEEYRMTCWAFVHLCLLGEPQWYRDGFLKLLRESAAKPEQPFNDLVKPCFKLSSSTLETILAAYSRSARSVGVSQLAPSPPDSKSVVREATVEETAGWKSRAFTWANRLDEAKLEQDKLQRFSAFHSQTK